MKFDGFEFKDYLIKAIKEIGFKEFSPIQKMIFTEINNNKNVIAKSKTGSGKTHSFLLPIFNELDENDFSCQAVIVAPTLELARQIYKMAQQLASFSPNTISIKAFYGGTDMEREIAKLQNKQPQIVIATPGKLIDLAINENVLKIHESKFFILDEVDMLADSFLEELFKISEKFKNAKKMVFSATIRESIEVILRKFLTNTQILEPKEESVSSLKISHYLIPIKYQDKDLLLEKLLKVINPYLAIIFANTKEDVARIYQFLKEKGYNVTSIHGDLNIRERKRIVNEINNLRYQYVVASDVASRGIDIIGVSHVINYNLPKDFEFYIHRSGRTGRMNMDGICYTLYDLENEEYLKQLENRGITFDYLQIKNDELVPFKGRNSRENRIKPQTEAEKKALNLVKKPTKVKPGYKKKYNKEKEDAVKKLNKRKWYS